MSVIARVGLLDRQCREDTKAFAELRKSSYEVAVCRIEEIERRYVAEAVGEERLALRRWVAKWAFQAATDRGGSFEDVSSRFEAMRGLGFTCPHSKASMDVEFACACGRFVRWEQRMRILVHMRGRLAGWGSGGTPA